MSARVALISFWRHGNPLNPVGASLLAMAECQPASMLDVPTLSRSSSLPQVSVAPTNACHTTKQRWERACSRWRSVSRHQCWMCRPYREQARSHRFQWRPQMLVTPQDKGGSELARDGGVSAGINAGCAGLIASKLAPTGFSDAHKCLSHHKTKVGASLLAMAECQPVSMLDVPASSRASSLPQVSVAPTNACHTTKQGWERACSRWWSVSRYQCWTCRSHREQARSHRTRRLASRSAGIRQNTTFATSNGSHSSRSTPATPPC
ncbi:hypothetical protein SAMN04490187_4034 [Pseudomonas jessenii]|uniref:Uncharacterized protein n=2 Tax=Pseudomonas TaxID=286 RepID=A0A1H4RSA4_PSEJE|nr:hypothetical protein SAMN04490187_4034 [Pseudomonas jessenii]VVP67746.1 hypothetical protein PS922_00153 [Pseudomonas fluorescens]